MRLSFTWLVSVFHVVKLLVFFYVEAVASNISLSLQVHVFEVIFLKEIKAGDIVNSNYIAMLTI